MSSLHSNPTKPATLVEGLEQLGRSGQLSPGLRLGPYRLVRQLGEGGMGVVWLADQLEPFERQVAIKLSTQQLGSGIAQAYFEVERQALAQLVHPYIAQIYDAGQLPECTGNQASLYFAMEFVDGDTLDAYVTNRQLSLRSSAELIAKVCQGADYAHQRGLIHRDLKPTNVLIAELAGTPIPKIIDFGIAIGVQSAQSTGSGSGAGTRAYMAPEQIERGPEGIDLRADVYALGSMLAEVLCLSLGVPSEVIQRTSFRSLLANLTIDASDSRESLNNHAAVPPSCVQRTRKTLQRLPSSLRAIALKAMAHDRNYRYESAAAVAADIARWLERRPVLARRGGRLYAMGCFVNRYRLASALGVLTILALVGGLITASYGLQAAKRAQALAETRRDQSDELIGYMLGDFAAKLADVGKLDLIDGVAGRALQHLQQANIGDAQSELQRATALRTLGDVQTQRGQWPAAKATFALAKTALDNAAAAYRKPPDAKLLYEQGQLAYWIGFCAYTDRDLKTAGQHWQQYLELAQQLQPLTKDTGLGLLETSYALSNLGTLASEQLDFSNALKSFKGAVFLQEKLQELQPKNLKYTEDLANSISWVAKISKTSGQLKVAAVYYREQIAVLKRSIARQASASLERELAIAFMWLSTLELQLGEIANARLSTSLATQALQKLVAIDPQIAANKRLLANAISDSAWVEYLDKNPEVAIANLGEALRILSASSGDRAWKRVAALTRCRAAHINAIANRATAAESLRKALGELDELSRSDASDRLSTIAFANCSLMGAAIGAEFVEVTRVLRMLSAMAMADQDVEILDPLVRSHILSGDAAGARLLIDRLSKLNYNNPDYLQFLSKNFHQRSS